MFRSFLWDFSSKFANQIIGFIVSVFLTRLLLPEEFGIMGIALVVIAFSNIFVDLGFGRAIIQQKEITEAQLSTVFIINLGISVLFTLLCLFLAYPLSIFFNQPKIEPVLKVLSISFLFYGLNLVPTALLYRKMNFKVISIISTTAALISGIVGIYMAKHGFGVWSLVAQNLVLAFFTFFLTSLFIRWLPKMILVLKEVKLMWKYSSRLFVSALLDTTFSRLDIFFIGKMFSPSILGYYTRAQTIDGVIRQISSTSIVSVMFPFLSRVQSDTKRVREIYLHYLHIISFIAFSLYCLLYITADSFFIILFTEKWLKAASMFKIITIAGFVYPVSALMVSILSSRGNSGAYLRAEVLKKLIILPAYIIGFFLGVNGFIYCLATSFILALVVNAYYVKREIQVTITNQYNIISKYALIAVLTAVIVKLIDKFILFNNVWAVLTFNIFIFLILIVLMNLIFRTEGFRLVIGRAKLLFKK